jgi:hypothetical protein
MIINYHYIETLLRVKKGVLDEFNNGTVELFYIDRYHYVHIQAPESRGTGWRIG